MGLVQASLAQSWSTDPGRTLQGLGIPVVQFRPATKRERMGVLYQLSINKYLLIVLLH